MKYTRGKHLHVASQRVWCTLGGLALLPKIEACANVVQLTGASRATNVGLLGTCHICKTECGMCCQRTSAACLSASFSPSLAPSPVDCPESPERPELHGNYK